MARNLVSARCKQGSGEREQAVKLHKQLEVQICSERWARVNFIANRWMWHTEKQIWTRCWCRFSHEEQRQEAVTAEDKHWWKPPSEEHVSHRPCLLENQFRCVWWHSGRPVCALISSFRGRFNKKEKQRDTSRTISGGWGDTIAPCYTEEQPQCLFPEGQETTAQRRKRITNDESEIVQQVWASAASLHLLLFDVSSTNIEDSFPRDDDVYFNFWLGIRVFMHSLRLN